MQEQVKEVELAFLDT